MTIVLARSRPFFGAQITCIPAVYAVSLLDGASTVFCKHKVGYIYRQLPWISEVVEESCFSKEILTNRGHNLVLNLRPKKRPHAKLIALFHRSFLLSVPTQVDTQTYRALWHLEPIHKKLGISANELLAKPFIELSSQSTLILEKDTLHIAIMPGAGAGNEKKWGVQNYLACFKSIKLAFPERYIVLNVILGPDEQQEKVLFEQQNSDQIKIHHNLCLTDLSYVILQSSLVIANDCGPSHIAQCLQKPSVILYDKEKPEWFYPHPQAKALFPAQGQSISTLSVEEVSRHACAILEQQ